MEASVFTELYATLWQEQLFELLYLKSTCWKALPLNLMGQPFIKEPLPAVGAWSLLFTQRPSLVVNMALFSQTKHGPSLEVARHTVWCAQTFRLLTGQLTLAVSSSCFTLLMCVYFYQPLWEYCPAFWQLSLTRNFSSRLKSLTIPKAPNPLSFRAQGWGGSSLKRTMALGSSIVGFFMAVMNESPHLVNYKHLAGNKLIGKVISEKYNVFT